MSDRHAALRRPDGKLDVTVVYLEMKERPGPSANLPPAGAKLALLRADQPTLHFYRYLYEAVGRPWLWIDRTRKTDAQLANEIHATTTEIFVLYADGAPAGFIEFDFEDKPDAHIVYFGLIPERLNQGLGRYFLRWGVQHGWDKPGVERLTVNTCNLDHPAALPLYQKVGFQPYRRQQIVFDPGPT